MNSPTKQSYGSIIKLNVGGKRFSTSKETLTWIPDSFFCSLLSGRISSFQDEKGAIFVDRDPEIFRVILNFLRTKEVSLNNVDIKSLKREAEFFGVTPLVNRLTVCQELDRTSCGNVLFHGMLQRPVIPSFPTDNLQTADNTIDRLSLQTNMNKPSTDTRQVLIITGHNSWIAVAYAHSVICYKVKESCGWQQVFVSPYLSEVVEKAAINAKVQGMAPDSKTRMVAVAFSSSIRLWSFQDENTFNEIGTFNMASQIEALFFIGSQLVSTGCKIETKEGKVGVWNAVSQHWQTQDVVPITSHDTAGAFLLLGGVNGVIYYIDMQKFPLRLKDNDLLITELYRDQSNAAITALSVYLTPKNSISAGNWIEVAYGTANGAVCVIVQHPELVGQGFQLFQTFTVHRSPVCKVVLSEKHLVSVCSDNNHVRTWTVTRFRGMISTQPGSTPLASYKVLSLEPLEPSASYSIGNDIGPHGEREEVPIFIQKLFPLSTILYIRLSSTGRRLAVVKSVDETPISCFCLRECEGSSRMGSRPRKYLFTGHSNGAIQIWDMTTAFDLTSSKGEKDSMGGPTQQEMLQLLGLCDLSVSPTDSPISGICVPNPDLLDRMLRSSNTSLSSTGTIVGNALQQPAQVENVLEDLVSASNLSCDANTSSKEYESSEGSHAHHRKSSLSLTPSGGIPFPGLTTGVQPRVTTQDQPLVRSDSTRSYRVDKERSKSTRSVKHLPERIKYSSGENSSSSTSSSPISPEDTPIVFTSKQTSSRINDESLNFIWRVPASSEEQGIKLRNLSLDDAKPSTSFSSRTGQARNSYKTAIMDSSSSPVRVRKTSRQRPASAIVLGSSKRSHRRQTSDVDQK